jgi:PEP-CTERM motif
MRHLGKALVAVALASTAANAQILNFEGINRAYPSGFAFINGFYNGGTSSDGTTGTNFGIEFSSNAQAICLNSLAVSCSNTSRGGLGNPGSQRGGLFFLDGSQTFMNRAAGFTNGFSFFYTAINSGGSFSVWTGLNGTGTLLGSLNLTTTTGSCPGYGAGFCPFSAAGLAFSGTAQSVTFSGVANQIVFDDVTFGNSVPDQPPNNNVVPEPATVVLMGSGLLMLGGIARRRRTTAV